MQKIKNTKELEQLYQQLADKDAKENSKLDEIIHICTGGGCIACGSLQIKTELEKKLTERGLDNKVKVKGTGCLGPCSKGPAIVLKKAGLFYQKMQVADKAIQVNF